MSQWISVKERLPEPLKPVLLCVSDKRLFDDGEKCQVLCGYYDNTIEDWYITAFRRDEMLALLNEEKRLHKITITHWQPLPDLPTE